MLTHHSSTPPMLARYPCKQVSHASANSTSFTKVIINTRLYSGKYYWETFNACPWSGWGEAWAWNTDFRNERSTGMCHQRFWKLSQKLIWKINKNFSKVSKLMTLPGTDFEFFITLTSSIQLTENNKLKGGVCSVGWALPNRVWFNDLWFVFHNSS